MTEPRGSDTRKKSQVVRLSADAKDTIRKLAAKWSISMGDLVEHMIDIFYEVNVKPNDFREYLQNEKEKAISAENTFSFLDQDCPALQLVEVDQNNSMWMCIWARENKPPIVKKISKMNDGAQKFCLGCSKTMEIVAGFREYESRIKELNAKVDKGVIVKIPACNKGGRISDDGKKLYCYPRGGEYVKVVVCQKLKKGAPCDHLRWTTLDVKGQFAEPEK